MHQNSILNKKIDKILTHQQSFDDRITKLEANNHLSDENFVKVILFYYICVFNHKNCTYNNLSSVLIRKLYRK
jgi:hypothetical protein